MGEEREIISPPPFPLNLEGGPLRYAKRVREWIKDWVHYETRLIQYERSQPPTPEISLIPTPLYLGINLLRIGNKGFKMFCSNFPRRSH